MSYSEREPSILLCEERMFDRVAKNKFKGSWSTYVTIPTVAYKYDVQTNSLDTDFVSEAVCALKDYYVSQGVQDIVNRIKDDLALSPSLIKAIIKNDDQMKSELEEDNNGRRSISSHKFVVFFDMVGRKFLPIVLSDEQYNNLKTECEDRSHFQHSIGDSKAYKLYSLSIPGMNNGIPLQPNEADISDLLHQKARKIRRKDASWSITFSGVSEYVDIVSSVYFDKNNIVDFSGQNPFFEGRASWLCDDVNLVLSSGHNTGLITQIQKMKDSIDLTGNSSGEKKNSLWVDCEEYVDSLYGKDRLLFPELKENLIRTIVKYTELVHLYKSEENSDIQRLEEAKKNYYVAVYTLIEKIFEHSFTLNYNESAIQQYQHFIDDIDSDGFCLFDYQRLAKEAGFDSELIPEDIRIYKENLRFMVDNQSNDCKGDIYSIIFLNLLEAHFSTRHPINSLSEKYVSLFELIEQSRKLRNPSKHGGKDEIKWNNFDLQRFALDLYDALVMNPINGTVNTNKFIEYENLDEEYQEISHEVDQGLAQYSFICNSPDAYNLAMVAVRAFLIHDAEYFSKASNLIQEILKQFTYILTGRNIIDPKVLDKYFEGELTSELVYQKAQEVLNQYDATYTIENQHYNVVDFKKVFTAKMSTGNLLMYFILAANAKNTLVFRDWLSKNHSAINAIQTVLQKREHNKATNFQDEEKEIEKIHHIILTFCDNTLQYIDNYRGEFE